MEQVLYELPDGWEWVDLSKVSTPSRQTLEPNDQEEYNYIGLEHIESNTGKLVNHTQTLGSKLSSSKVSFKKGMVLYGKLRPYLNKVIVAQNDGIATTEIIPFDCSEYINANFLTYFLRSQYFVNLAMNNCSGARMPRATTKLFMEIAKVPLVEMEEQKRIVKKLDALLTRINIAIEHLQESVALADTLVLNGIDVCFAELSKQNKECSLVKLVDFISGYAFKSSDFIDDDGIKPIKIANVGVVEFSENTEEFLPIDYKDKFHKFAARSNDIVIALTRPIINGGLKVCRVPESYDGALVNQRVAAITSENKNLLDFIYWFLLSSKAKSYVLEKSKSLNQPNLSITDLKKLLIPVPTDQQALKEAVINVNELATRARQAKAEVIDKIQLLNNLKSSILDSAFKGKL